VSVKSPELLQEIRNFRKDAGSIMSPFDAFLVLRSARLHPVLCKRAHRWPCSGLRTLPMRMDLVSRNGLAVARFLHDHPAVDKVMHPGLEDFPGHEIAARQQTGYGSTFSFTMRAGYEAAKALLENVHLCSVAVSLGGVDTLIGLLR